MPGALGDLVVKLSADVAQFSSDMGKAVYVANQSTGKIVAMAETAKKALGAIGVGFSIAGIVDFVKGGIEAQNMLYELSLRTGATVETLSALRSVAKQSGTDMELVATGVQKLSKNMLEATSGNGKAADAFAALGLKVTDANGQLKAGDAFILEVAQKLETMANQTQKVAYAQEIFGKTGANLLPFLHQLAETGELNAKVTTDQAKAAHEFEVSLAKLASQSGALKITIANELLPQLNKVLDAFIEGKKQAGFFEGAIRAIGVAVSGTAAHKANVEIAGLVDTMMELRNEQDKARKAGASPAYIADMEIGINKVKDRIKLLQKVRELEGDDGKPGGDKAKIDVPLPGGGGDDGAAKRLQEFNDLMAKASMKRLQVQEETERAGAAAAEKSQQELLHLLAQAAQKRQQIEDSEANAADHKLDQLKQMAERYRDLIDPAKKYRDEIAKIDELERANVLTLEEAGDLREKLSKQAQEAALNMDGLAKKTKETDDWARHLGITFTSSAERALEHWTGFRSLLSGIATDIQRMVFRQTVTAPLGSWVSDAVKGAGIGDFFKGLFPSFDVGTDYVPRDMLAMVHQGEKITPAAENGGSGPTIFIDARGADREGMAQLTAVVAQLNGSIEARSVAAVSNARRRGIPV